MSYKLSYSRQAQKDLILLRQQPALKKNAEKLLKIIMVDPYQFPPPFKYLEGDLEGYISRRINLQHRLVYEVLDNEKEIYIVSAWSHYAGL